VGGTVLFSIAAEVQFAATLKGMGFKSDNLPERAAEILLQTLVLSRAEAEKIARRPLPDAEPRAVAGEPAAPQIAKLHSAAAGMGSRKRSKRRVLPG
jgi:hypothetical protein